MQTGAQEVGQRGLDAQVGREIRVWAQETPVEGRFDDLLPLVERPGSQGFHG